MILSSLVVTALAGIYLGAYWVAQNVSTPFGWWAGVFSGLIFTGLIVFGWIQILARMPASNA